MNFSNYRIDEDRQDNLSLIIKYNKMSKEFNELVYEIIRELTDDGYDIKINSDSSAIHLLKSENGTYYKDIVLRVQNRGYHAYLDIHTAPIMFKNKFSREYDYIPDIAEIIELIEN